VFGKATTDSTGLLGTEVERHVLLGLVEQTELLPLLGVEDSQSTGDRLADIVATRRRIVSLSVIPHWGHVAVGSPA